ncbi:MAG: hypothetical protein LBJ70_05500, partial [Holosporales bacterium]|nr:hypothetical protein [Holosporales bacterium]
MGSGITTGARFSSVYGLIGANDTRDASPESFTFFPQLVAGPIVHHSEMMPQFASKEVRIFNPLNFYRGMTLL